MNLTDAVGLIGLNPYSNGRYSESLACLFARLLLATSLNPYSNGRYSERVPVRNVINALNTVLILILMEDTLRAVVLAGRQEAEIVS